MDTRKIGRADIAALLKAITTGTDARHNTKMIVTTLDTDGRDLSNMFKIYHEQYPGSQVQLERCVLADDVAQVAYCVPDLSGAAERFAIPLNYEIVRGNITIWQQRKIENGAVEWINLTVENRAAHSIDDDGPQRTRRIIIRRPKQ